MHTQFNFKIGFQHFDCSQVKILWLHWHDIQCSPSTNRFSIVNHSSKQFLSTFYCFSKWKCLKLIIYNNYFHNLLFICSFWLFHCSLFPAELTRLAFCIWTSTNKFNDNYNIEWQIWSCQHEHVKNIIYKIWKIQMIALPYHLTWLLFMMKILLTKSSVINIEVVRCIGLRHLKFHGNSIKWSCFSM